MSKTIVVLFGLNAEHEIVGSQYGIAFAIGKLAAQQYIALYVATSPTDARAAIDHYSQQGTLEGFVAGHVTAKRLLDRRTELEAELARLNTAGGDK